MKLVFLTTPGVQSPLNVPPLEDCKLNDFLILFISKEKVKKNEGTDKCYAVIDNTKNLMFLFHLVLR